MRDDDLVRYLLRPGDTCLVLSRALSERCGRAGGRDFTDHAVDLGREARQWLQLAADIAGDGTTADDLANTRPPSDMRTLLIAEVEAEESPRVAVRQLLFDAWHVPFLKALTRSRDARIAAVAELSLPAAQEHLRRSSDCLLIACMGGTSPRDAAQEALEALWPYAMEPFQRDTFQEIAAREGIGPDREEIGRPWRRHISETLLLATLTMPLGTHLRIAGGRQTNGTRERVSRSA